MGTPAGGCDLSAPRARFEDGHAAQGFVQGEHAQLCCHLICAHRCLSLLSLCMLLQHNITSPLFFSEASRSRMPIVAFLYEGVSMLPYQVAADIDRRNAVFFAALNEFAFAFH